MSSQLTVFRLTSLQASIDSLTGDAKMSTLGLFQMQLITLRMTLVSFKTGAKTPQTELLGILSFLLIELQSIAVLAAAPPRFDPCQAALFHRLVCHQMLVNERIAALHRHDLTSDELSLLTTRQQRSKAGLVAFVARTFDDETAKKVSQVLEPYAKRAPA